MNLADFLYFFENYILLIYVKNERSQVDLGWQYHVFDWRKNY